LSWQKSHLKSVSLSFVLRFSSRSFSYLCLRYSKAKNGSAIQKNTAPHMIIMAGNPPNTITTWYVNFIYENLPRVRHLREPLAREKKFVKVQ